jgi:hypothetical protein
MARRKRSNLKGIEKFQGALVDVGMPDMMRSRRSKKRAKLLMNEVHKDAFPTKTRSPASQAGLS